LTTSRDRAQPLLATSHAGAGCYPAGRMPAPTWWPEGGLWRHPEFLRLWAAQMVSAFGSRITRTALPILAVLALGRGDAALGVLAALQLGPAVAVALVAGGLVDRGAKRRILVAADLVRAVLVASLPIAAWLGHLTMIHIYVVAAGVGAATSLFRITDGAFLPALVGIPYLAEGNAKLEATEATAEIAGPAAGGALIGLLGAPLAVLVDAATYLWSAVMLGSIRAPAGAAPPRPDGDGGGSLADDLRVGLGAVFGPPILRRLVLAEMALSVAGGTFMALYAIYCLRDLHLSATAFGVVISVGGIGSLAGAALSRRLPRSIGLGPTLIVLSAIATGGLFLIPAAGLVGGGAPMFALLVAHQLVGDGAAVAYEVNAVTLRQTLLPPAQLGRANAAIMACTTSMMLGSALAAGALGGVIGTDTILYIGPGIGLAAPVALFGLRALAEIPRSDR
jgi:Major Facilitator Superfamily